MRILLLTFLAACDSSATIPSDTDTGSEDTDTNENIGEDTADSADTGTAPADLAWDVTGDTDGTAFALVSLDISDTGVTMADIAVESEAATRIEVSLPEVDDLLVESADAPGLYLAFFLGALHEDDGDVKWDPDERWFGTATNLTVYLDGIVPKEYLDLGLKVGWNTFAQTETDFTILDPLAQSLPVQYTPALELGGDLDDTVPDVDSVTTVAVAMFSGMSAPALDYGPIGAEEWTVWLDGEPPASHFYDDQGAASPYAAEVFLGYQDNEGGLGWDPGADPYLGFACFNDHLVEALWLRPTSDLVETMNYVNMGANPGWNALELVDTGGSPSFIDAAGMQSLTMSTVCAPA